MKKVIFFALLIALTTATAFSQVRTVHQQILDDVPVNTSGAFQYLIRDNASHVLQNLGNAPYQGFQMNNRKMDLYLGDSLNAYGIYTDLSAPFGVFGIFTITDTIGSKEFDITTDGFNWTKYDNTAGWSIGLSQEGGSLGRYFDFSSDSALNVGTVKASPFTISTNEITRDSISSNGAYRKITATTIELGTNGIKIFTGVGSPEGVITAKIGSLYLRAEAPADSTMYSKATGTGNTGWVPK